MRSLRSSSLQGEEYVTLAFHFQGVCQGSGEQESPFICLCMSLGPSYSFSSSLPQSAVPP